MLFNTHTLCVMRLCHVPAEASPLVLWGCGRLADVIECLLSPERGGEAGVVHLVRIIRAVSHRRSLVSSELQDYSGHTAIINMNNTLEMVDS